MHLLSLCSSSPDLNVTRDGEKREKKIQPNSVNDVNRDGQLNYRLLQTDQLMRKLELLIMMLIVYIEQFNGESMLV